MKSRSFFLLLTLSFFELSFAHAGEVRLAVASNFRSTMTSIVEVFEANSEYKVLVSYGSTGKHYAQILNGAPYDLFFAADAERPALLEQQGFIVTNSRYTYAVGKLVLWGRLKTDSELSAESLTNDNIRYISLANPKLAPYGNAAEQVISALQLTHQLAGKLVRGDNIAQAFQFVDSGNAELGFVANSQVITREKSLKGSVWPVPQNLYDPIQQQVVLIKNTEASNAFYQFIKSDHARTIIRQAGYDIH